MRIVISRRRCVRRNSSGSFAKLAAIDGGEPGSVPNALLARRPTKVAALALANKIATSVANGAFPPLRAFGGDGARRNRSVLLERHRYQAHPGHELEKAKRAGCANFTSAGGGAIEDVCEGTKADAKHLIENDNASAQMRGTTFATLDERRLGGDHCCPFSTKLDDMVRNRRRGQATTAVCHRTRKAFIHTSTPHCRMPLPARSIGRIGGAELLSVYCEQQPRQLLNK